MCPEPWQMIILTFRNMKKDIETLLDQALTGQLLERPQVEELRCSFHSIGGAAALPAILHPDRHKKGGMEGLRLCLRSSMPAFARRQHWRGCGLPAILHADHSFKYSNRNNCVCGLLISRSSFIVRQRTTALLQHVECGALVELSVEFLRS